MPESRKREDWREILNKLGAQHTEICGDKKGWLNCTCELAGMIRRYEAMIYQREREDSHA